MTRLGDLVTVGPLLPDVDEIDRAILLADIDVRSATAEPRRLRDESERGRLDRVAASGDVIFAQISPSMENGKLAIVPPLERGAVLVSSELLVLRARREGDASLVWAFLRRRAVREGLAEFMVGSTRPRLPREVLEAVEIPDVGFDRWPAAREALAVLDKAIRLRRRSLEILGRLAAPLVASAARGQPRVSLDDVAEVIAGIGQRGVPGGDTILLRPADLHNGRVEVGPKSTVYVAPDVGRVPFLRVGDLIIARRGSDAVRGKAAVYDGEPNRASFGSGLACIRGRRLSGELLWAWLQTAEARARLDAEVVGTSVPTWSTGTLATLPAPLLETAEAVGLSKAIRSIRLAAGSARRQLMLLEAVVQTYLDRVFEDSDAELVALPPFDALEELASPDPIPPELRGIFDRASAMQKAVWEEAASTVGVFRAADQVGADRDRAGLQHTLSLLEQLGVLISERDGLIDRWRVPDPVEDVEN